MSDIAEIPVDEQERPLPPPPRPVRSALTDGPILRTLLGLAWPNVVALSAGTCVVIAETSYIGRLGVEALAAMALVFPTVILTMTMSGGAMGGAVASAIARALGAGDRERAGTLAAHALLIGITFGLVFMLGMLIFGPKVLEMLGGRGDCADACDRLHAGVFRRRRAALAAQHHGRRAARHRQHEAAVAVDAEFRGHADRAWRHAGPRARARAAVRHARCRGRLADRLFHEHLRDGLVSCSPAARASFRNCAGLRIQWAMFFDILKVGAIACFSPLQSVLTISIFTHMLAKFGTAILAGYGIGARLEFLLTSIAFSFGIASVPMIGMAIGAGRIARARRIAWIAGASAFVAVGAPACLVALFPDLWVNIFTDSATVRATSHQYLSTVAPFYAFIGLASTMYFSSQGAAKVIGPVLAQTARLIYIATCGWWLSTHDATAQNFFWLAASSMVVLGLLSCSSVVLTRWGPRETKPAVRPVLSVVD